MDSHHLLVQIGSIASSTGNDIKKAVGAGVCARPNQYVAGQFRPKIGKEVLVVKYCMSCVIFGLFALRTYLST